VSLLFAESTRKEILPNLPTFQQNSLRSSQDICSGNLLINISSGWVMFKRKALLLLLLLI